MSRISCAPQSLPMQTHYKSPHAQSSICEYETVQRRIISTRKKYSMSTINSMPHTKKSFLVLCMLLASCESNARLPFLGETARSTVPIAISPSGEFMLYEIERTGSGRNQARTLILKDRSRTLWSQVLPAPMSEYVVTDEGSVFYCEGMPNPADDDDFIYVEAVAPDGKQVEVDRFKCKISLQIDATTLDPTVNGVLLSSDSRYFVARMVDLARGYSDELLFIYDIQTRRRLRVIDTSGVVFGKDAHSILLQIKTLNRSSKIAGVWMPISPSGRGFEDVDRRTCVAAIIDLSNGQTERIDMGSLNHPFPGLNLQDSVRLDDLVVIATVGVNVKSVQDRVEQLLQENKIPGGFHGSGMCGELYVFRGDVDRVRSLLHTHLSEFPSLQIK